MKIFSKMITSFIVLLALFSNIFGDSSRIQPNYSGGNLTVTERMLIQILKECNLGLTNTIYYTGNNPELTQALLKTSSPVDPKSWILVPTIEYVQFGNLTAINGYVAVFNSHNEWDTLLWRIMLNWRCVKDCKVIFLSKVPQSCTHAHKTITTLGHAYYETIYYICNHKNLGPIVFTQDKYRDIRQPYWYRTEWEVDSFYRGSFYLRKYNADLCRNFNFYRLMPTEETRILVGVKRKVTTEAKMLQDFIFRKDISILVPKSVDFDIPLFEKLLKTQFRAYIKSYLYKKSENAEELNPTLWIKTHVDIMGKSQLLVYNGFLTYFNPLNYETWVILSFKQAEATPLEKIAKFYGIWTVISLTILSIITFVVIYLKSNKNATLAAFDVLRLLINSGVEIPINTLSLKIFFCMVFLYFTVIHATFSGNLPRFLTIPEIHDTIDSLEDLLDPRITTIYDNGFYNEDNKPTNEIIIRKRKHLRDNDDLIEHFLADQNSVCIMIKDHALVHVMNKDLKEKVYISKDEFGESSAGHAVRRRFFLQEKFQWASTYLFDVGMSTYFRTAVMNANRMIEKHEILSQIDFREISLCDLRFVFTLLIVGNTFGLVCFFIELAIGRKYHQKIRFNIPKKCMTFKRKKARNNIQRIVVKPKPLESALIVTEIAGV